MAVAEAIGYICSTERATAKTEQEMELTAPMDGPLSSLGSGCVTPAPRIITGA